MDGSGRVGLAGRCVSKAWRSFFLEPPHESLLLFAGRSRHAWSAKTLPFISLRVPCCQWHPIFPQSIISMVFSGASTSTGG